MIYHFKPKPSQNVKLWVNESPELNNDVLRSINVEIPVANAEAEDRTLAVEFSDVFRHCSNYALLCAKYQYGKSSTILVKIDVSNPNGAVYKHSIPNIGGEIRSGIIDEYSYAILDAVKDYVQEGNGLIPGLLHFYAGAYGNVGSSPLAFYRITRMVLTVLAKCTRQQDIELSGMEQELNAIIDRRK